MRLFVALPLPGEIRRALGEMQDRLRPTATAAGARFVRPEGIHLTLRFLGETPEARLTEVGAGLTEAVAVTGAIALEAVGAGFFPGPARPRVLWVGLAGDLEALVALAERCEKTARLLGFPPEDRPFRPHLTLARIDERSARGGRAAREDLAQAVRGWEGRPLGRWTARSARLYQSVLGPGGAVYTVRLEIPLDRGREG